MPDGLSSTLRLPGANERQFYVYEHWRIDTGVCFYVGKGRKKRAWILSRRNAAHYEITALLRTKQMAPDVRLVCCELSEKEAFVEEKKRIKFWRDQGAILTNCTNGGEGHSGYLQSRESIERGAAKRRGQPVPLSRGLNISQAKKGKPLSEKHKKALAAAHLGKSNGPHAAETRLKIAAAITRWHADRRSACQTV